MAQPDPQPASRSRRGSCGPPGACPPEPARTITLPVEWPGEVTREWAWGGVDRQGRARLHPRQRRRRGASARRATSSSRWPSRSARTAKPWSRTTPRAISAGTGRPAPGSSASLAPDCELTSVRVLGAGFTGSGDVLLAGLRWAVEQGFDVVNMSLSTTKRQFAGILHELTDTRVLPAHGARRVGAQHAGRELPVALLLGHLRRQPRGAGPDRPSTTTRIRRSSSSRAASTSRSPGPGGARIRCTGNSFATPHMSGLCALVLGKHPELTPFQLKSVLYLTSSNVGGGR